MNQKHLVFFLFAMTISFTLILGVMIVFTDTKSSSSVHKKQRVLSQNKTISSQQFQQDRISKSTQTSTQLKSEKSSTPNQSKTREIHANPREMLNEFSSLKKDLRQQIGSLEHDRSTMLSNLAKILGQLKPNQIAEELSIFDDETTEFIINQYEADFQKAIKAEIKKNLKL